MRPSFLRERADRLAFVCNGFSLSYILQTLADELAAEEAAAVRALTFFAPAPASLITSIAARLDAMRADLADATLIPVRSNDPVHPNDAARVPTLRHHIESALRTGALVLHYGRLLTAQDHAALSAA